MEWWHVYLFTRLDSIKEACVGLSIIGGIVSFACGMFYFSAEGCGLSDDNIKHLRRGMITAVAIFLFSGLIQLAVPNQKEAAAIYLLPKLAHSDFAKEAQQIPTDAAKLMRMKLESWIADMDPKKSEKK